LKSIEKGEDMPKEQLSTEQEFEKFILEPIPDISVEVMEWCLENKEEVKRLLHISPLSKDEKIIHVLLVGSGLERDRLKGKVIKYLSIGEEILSHRIQDDIYEILSGMNASQSSDSASKKTGTKLVCVNKNKK
jgi:hypothetical protein